MSDSSTPIGVSRQEINVGGSTRTYRLYVPASAEGRPSPLLLAFHGRLGTGNAQARLSNFDAVADRFNFIAAYPDGIGRSWNAGHGTGRASHENIDDVGFVAALIDHLATSGAIDRKQVYAAGMSAGGIFAHRLACELAQHLRGIAAVAGTMGAQTAQSCSPRRPISVIQFHGTADPVVPWSGGETRGGGRVLSVEDTVSGWLKRNRCPTQHRSTETKGDSTCTVYQPCADETRVVLCRIEGGGHTWPSGASYLPERIVGRTSTDINASEYIWKSFENLPD